MNDNGDFLNGELGQRLSQANPYDVETVQDHLPERSGELMLREITAKRQRNFFGWLAGGLEGPAFSGFTGRAAFVSVLGAIAIAIVGLNFGNLTQGDQQEAALPTVAEIPTGNQGDGQPSDGAVSPTLPPLVVDDATTTAPTSTEPPTATTASTGERETSTTETSRPIEDCVSIEAEQLELTGGWGIGYDNRVSDGEYITWDGLSPEQQNNSPVDVLEVEFAITTPGTYRFVWAMRQPIEVSESSANSSWVNFSDADRFGPVEGGTFEGFVAVVGAATGEFDWSATAVDDGQKSQIGIVFESAGNYTMELAGRSHGHEIDRIVIYPESMNEDEATEAECR